ncbi:MAG: hypothetical protein ACOVQI_05175, partial [Tagaea sp.]
MDPSQDRPIDRLAATAALAAPAALAFAVLAAFDAVDWPWAALGALAATLGVAVVLRRQAAGRSRG